MEKLVIHHGLVTDLRKPNLFSEIIIGPFQERNIPRECRYCEFN